MNSEILAWQSSILVILFLIVGTMLAVIFMRHQRSLVEARAAVSREGAYHDLAASTAAELARLANEVAELRTSVAAVEGLIREVET